MGLFRRRAAEFGAQAVVFVVADVSYIDGTHGLGTKRSGQALAGLNRGGASEIADMIAGS